MCVCVYSAPFSLQRYVRSSLLLHSSKYFDTNTSGVQIHTCLFTIQFPGFSPLLFSISIKCNSQTKCVLLFAYLSLHSWSGINTLTHRTILHYNRENKTNRNEARNILNVYTQHTLTQCWLILCFFSLLDSFFSCSKTIVIHIFIFGQILILRLTSAAFMTQYLYSFGCCSLLFFPVLLYAHYFGGSFSLLTYNCV